MQCKIAHRPCSAYSRYVTLVLQRTIQLLWLCRQTPEGDSKFLARPMNYGHWYWYSLSFGSFRRQPGNSLHQNPDTTPLKNLSVTGGCLISFCAKRQGHEGIAKWSTLSQKGAVASGILPRSACDSEMDCGSAFCHVESCASPSWGDSSAFSPSHSNPLAQALLLFLPAGFRRCCSIRDASSAC